MILQVVQQNMKSRRSTRTKTFPSHRFYSQYITTQRRFWSQHHYCDGICKLSRHSHVRPTKKHVVCCTLHWRYANDGALVDHIWRRTRKLLHSTSHKQFVFDDSEQSTKPSVGHEHTKETVHLWSIMISPEILPLSKKKAKSLPAKIPQRVYVAEGQYSSQWDKFIFDNDLTSITLLEYTC